MMGANCRAVLSMADICRRSDLMPLHFGGGRDGRSGCHHFWPDFVLMLKPRYHAPALAVFDLRRYLPSALEAAGDRLPLRLAHAGWSGTVILTSDDVPRLRHVVLDRTQLRG